LVSSAVFWNLLAVLSSNSKTSSKLSPPNPVFSIFSTTI
jgi:hypothetical protein